MKSRQPQNKSYYVLKGSVMCEMLCQMVGPKLIQLGSGGTVSPQRGPGVKPLEAVDFEVFKNCLKRFYRIF